jgi:DNA-binding NtrC family response regulator
VEKSFKKRAALISRDKPTAKLIDFMLDNSDISTELVLSAAELNETFAKKESPPPNLIIYDCDSSRQGEELVCQPLKEYSHYDKTPKLVISTFKVDCGSCTEFKFGKCAHIQKPFKLLDMVNTVNELVLHKLSD